MVDIDLDYCQIGFLIGTDHFGIVLHTRRIVFKANANGTIPTGAAEAGTLLSGTAKEMIEEIIHAAAVVVITALVLSATAPVNVLDGRFCVDINDAGLQLFCD